jgi:hypothetical protein
MLPCSIEIAASLVVREAGLYTFCPQGENR